MNKSLLVPAFALIGICAGCGTGPGDVKKAEANYQEAQRDADQMVVDAKQDGAENVHETRKVVLDDINAENKDVHDALKDADSSVAEERADVEQAAREGKKQISETEAARQKEIADAKIAAGQKVADARRDLEETKRKAIEDGKKRITKCEEALSKQEQQLADATAAVATAASRLKDANDDNRVELQSDLDDAKKAEGKAQADVAAAKAELAKEQSEPKKV